LNAWQAFRYFFSEALSNLARSWKISLVAIFTIAMSVFLGGLFYLVTKNVGESLTALSEEIKLTVYLQDEIGLDSPEARSLVAELEAADWVTHVDEVSSSEAMATFQRNFPSLEDLSETWEGAGLPPSIEASLKPSSIRESEFDEWLERLSLADGVALVDDDRDWLAQLSTLMALARGVGLGLGAALLIAAVFTIASVIRLTAFQYLDEIAVMRMVGATEFYIRGPFYAEGLVQGLLGGVAAVAAIQAAWYLVATRAGASLWLPLLSTQGLTGFEWVLLVILGGLAGLFGAVLSLRREKLVIED
jgi:cell division transport system permease protein